MKKLQVQLKEIAKALAKLTKQVDKISTQVKTLEKPAKKSVKKAAPKKAAAKKAAPKKAVAKKAAPKKKAVKKAAPAKKSPGAKKKTAAKGSTVLDTVFDVIKRSKKGASIAMLKEKTQLNPRQLSNALYKLSTREKIAAVSRGVYKKK